MNNKRKCLALLIVLMCGVILVACGKTTATKKNQTNAKNQNRILDISNIDEAYDAILNSSSQKFIGYHLVDESFLGWVTGEYGTDVIESIASQVTLDDANVWYEETGKSIHVLWLDYCKYSGFQSYSLKNVYEKDAASIEEIVLDFTGDLTLADHMSTTEYMLQQPDGLADCMSDNLVDEMNGADIMMINNEFAYTSQGSPLEGKAYTFRANPERVTELNKLGVDIVNLANNHIWDYGEVGVLDTLQTLQNANMPYVGAGANIDDASQPVYFVINGKKIAIVSATQIERSYNYTKEATENMAGVLKTLNPEKYVEVIKKARKNSDYVIAVAHWGTEGNASYGADQVSLAKKFAEAGADVIVGGHTHCLQGVEYIDDVPVYYSLGNFYFSSTGNMPADYDTGMAQIVINESGEIEIRFLPCEFSNGVTTLLEDGNKKKEIINKMQELSSGVIIDDGGNITKK